MSSIDADVVPTNVKMNTGAWFILFIVVAAFCFLISRFSSDKFPVVDCCKVFCIMCIQWIRKLIDYASNSSFLNANNWVLSRQTARYDVLNISEELEAEYAANTITSEAGMNLLNRVFDEENVPSFTRERYIRVLRDNWITSIDHLKQLNHDDWMRFGFPQNIQKAIMLQLTPKNNKMHNDGRKASKQQSERISDASSNLSQELEYPNEALLAQEPTFDVTITDERTNGDFVGRDISDTSFSDF